MFISDDNGANWDSINNGLTSNYNASMAVKDQNIYVVNDTAIFLSTDNGSNWINSSNGLPSDDFSTIIVNGDNIFTACYYHGIYMSTDNGANWAAINTGLPDYYVYSLFVNGPNIYAGIRSSGVWRRPLSEITGIAETDKTSPDQFLLEQNYPNPFNPVSKIKYSVPQHSQVIIKVLDILGNEIETLTNEEKSAGIYEISFNADHLPSGVYFYKMQAGQFIETKKMILLK
jgi:hypothetical protein